MMSMCRCGNTIQAKRWALGYKTCKDCGEKEAQQVKHTIVPMHKSNYIPIRDLDLLKGINSKVLRDT